MSTHPRIAPPAPARGGHAATPRDTTGRSRSGGWGISRPAPTWWPGLAPVITAGSRGAYLAYRPPQSLRRVLFPPLRQQ
jgi:hypothetical protein